MDPTLPCHRVVLPVLSPCTWTNLLKRSLPYQSSPVLAILVKSILAILIAIKPGMDIAKGTISSGVKGITRSAYIRMFLI